MPERYSAEFLLHLRESPLCVRPPTLPPPEDWMGYVSLSLRPHTHTCPNPAAAHVLTLVLPQGISGHVPQPAKDDQ